MILDSPQFLGLKIYVGQHPVPGSFYSPKYGDTLSHVANWAYGVGALSYVLKINKSPWNIANCIYRKKSTSCSSAVVVSGLAASQNNWSDGAWLALCPGDSQGWAQSLGLNYPVLWIPGLNGEEPGDLADEPIALTCPPGSTLVGGECVAMGSPTPRIPGGDRKGGGGSYIIGPTDPSNGRGNGGGSGSISGNGKASWPWLLGLVLVVGVGGTAYYFYRQGKVSPRRAYA